MQGAIWEMSGHFNLDSLAKKTKRSRFTKPFNERRLVTDGMLRYFDRAVIHCLGLRVTGEDKIFYGFEIL